MRLRLLIVVTVISAAAAPAVVRANQSRAHEAQWQWRAATTTRSPQQLVRTPGVALLGSGGASGLSLLVEADGQFVQKVRSAATEDAPVAAFVVAEPDGTETVVGVARSDVAHLILRGSDGTEHELSLNERGAFAAPSVSAGTDWQLDALASDGSSVSHLALPRAGAPCGGAVGPCRVATGSPRDSMYPASPLTTVATARVAGKTWKLQTYLNRRGFPCVQLVGGGGQARNCSPGHTAPVRVKPVWGAERSAATTGWSRVWIFGEVAPSVRRMTLLRECGGEVFNFPAGPWTRRWFLRVYTPSQLKAGGMPLELSMRDAAGVVVSDQHAALSAAPKAPPTPSTAACSARRQAWALAQARYAAFHRVRTLPRAFRRPARPSDRLPSRLARIVEAGPSGTPDHVVASRLVATYTDGRGRRAALYLIESLYRICTVTTWGSGAGGGCNPIDNPFGGRHMVGGSGHLYSGVVDDSVAKVVVVGRLGVRHQVKLTTDGGFIYDCRAYSGCTCVVSPIEAYNKQGKIIQSEQLPIGCRNTSSAAASASARPDYTKINGTVSWLFHHKPRGSSLETAGLVITDTVGSHWQPVRFARVVQPDPASRYRVVLSLIGKRGRNICMTEFAGRTALGGGCAIGLDLKPFNFTAGSPGPGAPSPRDRLIMGVASDEVARMAVVGKDGHSASIPLKDNVFFALLPKDSTARLLVAYDRNGLVMRMSRIPALIKPFR